MVFINYFSVEHIVNLILFGIICLIWILLNRWINNNLEKILKNKGWFFEDSEKNFKKLIKQTLLLLFSILALESLIIGHEEFSITNITHFELFGFDFEEKTNGQYDRFSFTIGTIFYLLFIIITSKILVNIFRIIIHNSTKEKKWIDEGGKYTIITLSKYLIYSIAIIVGIQGIGFNITLFVASSAALFVGIGFGLQTILADVFSGIILLFDGSIKVGDILEMQNNKISKVQHIFIRTSQLKTLDGKTIIVPNSVLTKENIINWTISDTITRFSISIGIGYGSNLKKVKEILYQSAANHPLVYKKKKIYIELHDFGRDALEFKVYFWAEKTWEIINIKSDIRIAIYESLKKNEIKIPFQQRELHINTNKTK